MSSWKIYRFEGKQEITKIYWMILGLKAETLIPNKLGIRLARVLGA